MPGLPRFRQDFGCERLAGVMAKNEGLPGLLIATTPCIDRTYSLPENYCSPSIVLVIIELVQPYPAHK